MKIISIVGARPQFIKLAPLSKKLSEISESIIVHTGQHYNKNMSEQFFIDLDIDEPKYNLEIGSGKHGKQTGQMLGAIEQVLESEAPNVVIVFGDTNSTLAGALAAVKMQIPTVHIEAGLRSFNREMPEEINRIVADHCSDLLFAPTDIAMKNLENDNLIEKSFLTGDIMVDALIDNLKKAEETSTIIEDVDIKGDYSLLTLHRPYNVDSPQLLSKILNLMSKPGQQIIFPIHPRTKKMLDNFNININGNIKLIDPVGYLDFVWLEKNSNRIITDSGGIQKEAYLLKKPCITLRTETEWVETVDSGWNILLQPGDNNFVDVIKNFRPSGVQKTVFGTDVTNKMVEIILERYKKN